MEAAPMDIGDTIPPLVIVILGHGSDDSNTLTDIPFVVSTPPGSYSFHYFAPDLNFVTTLSNLYKDNVGISQKETVQKMELQRDRFLSEGIVYDTDPDMMDERRPDPKGVDTVWRETRLNMVVCPGDPEIYHHKSPTSLYPCDTTGVGAINTYTPYGIYDIESFPVLDVITEANYDIANQSNTCTCLFKKEYCLESIIF